MKDQSSSRQPSAGVHVVQPDHLGNAFVYFKKGLIRMRTYWKKDSLEKGVY